MFDKFGIWWFYFLIFWRSGISISSTGFLTTISFRRDGNGTCRLEKWLSYGTLKNKIHAAWKVHFRGILHQKLSRFHSDRVFSLLLYYFFFDFWIRFWKKGVNFPINNRSTGDISWREIYGSVGRPTKKSLRPIRAHRTLNLARAINIFVVNNECLKSIFLRIS